MTRAFFDTNVLLYLVSSDEPRKQALARRLYERHSVAGSVVLSVQVLHEFFAVVTRKFVVKISFSNATRIVGDFAMNEVMPLDIDLTFAAIARVERHALNFWDALIVESALRAKAEVLYTEDLQHGQMIDGLRIENPFRELN